MITPSFFSVCPAVAGLLDAVRQVLVHVLEGHASRRCRACRPAAWRSTRPASGRAARPPPAGAATSSRCGRSRPATRRGARGRWCRAGSRRHSRRSRSGIVSHTTSRSSCVDGLERLLRVRQGLHQVGRIDEPALDRVGLAADSVASRMLVVMPSSANGYCTASAPSARGLVRLRVLGQRVGRDLHARRRRTSRPCGPSCRAARSAARSARLRCVSSPYQLTRRPGWMMVAGRWLANSRAAARISSADTPRLLGRPLDACSP